MVRVRHTCSAATITSSLLLAPAVTATPGLAVAHAGDEEEEGDDDEEADDDHRDENREAEVAPSRHHDCRLR